MTGITVRLDDDLHSALHTAAQARGLSDAELVRRLVSRGLAVDGSDAQALVLAEAVRAVVRDELRHTRRLAFLAAFEGAAAHRAAEDVIGSTLLRVARMPRPEIEDLVGRQKGGWARYAAQRVRDPEPADPDDDAPVAELPEADEVAVTADTAAMLAGSDESSADE